LIISAVFVTSAGFVIFGFAVLIFGFAFTAFTVIVLAAALAAALRTGFFADRTTVGFFAAVLFAAIFFATVLLAIGFFAVVFFVATFFATVFLTTAFLAAGFFAAALTTRRFAFAASAAFVLLLFALAVFVPLVFADFVFVLFAFLAFFFAAAMDGVSFFGPPRAMPLSARDVLRGVTTRMNRVAASDNGRSTIACCRSRFLLRRSGLMPTEPDAIG
jgi:hypothetical protein